MKIIKSDIDCKLDLCFERNCSESKRRQYFTDEWRRVDPVEYVNKI